MSCAPLCPSNYLAAWNQRLQYPPNESTNTQSTSATETDAGSPDLMSVAGELTESGSRLNLNKTVHFLPTSCNLTLTLIVHSILLTIITTSTPSSSTRPLLLSLAAVAKKLPATRRSTVHHNFFESDTAPSLNLPRHHLRPPAQLRDINSEIDLESIKVREQRRIPSRIALWKLIATNMGEQRRCSETDSPR